MKTSTMTPEIFAAWTERLDACADGLDFADADDRVTFRGRITTETAATKCVMLGALVQSAGHVGPLLSNRGLLVRLLAATWIGRRPARAP